MSDAQKYSSKLHASRILIIGGSSGIGYAVAEACLESGARVAISSSNPQRVESALSSLQSSYPSKKSHIHGLTVDLSKPDTLESELEQILQGAAQKLGQNGKLDHVVFTAGDALAEIKLPDMTYKNVVAAGQVRFFAPLLLAKFLPQCLEDTYKSSYTITTGSISEHTIPNWSVIASYAGGHHSMVRNLALDMKPIRVSYWFLCGFWYLANLDAGQWCFSGCGGYAVVEDAGGGEGENARFVCEEIDDGEAGAGGGCGGELYGGY